MNCTKCGAANRLGAKFCDECGQSLRAAVTTPPIPGPHPGMRYRRRREEDAAESVTPGTPPPSREPERPPPRREPPADMPKREASVPVTRRRAASAAAAAVPAPRRRDVSLPEDEPMFSAEAMHRRSTHEDVRITTPQPRPKRSDSGDRDNATIMIVLALVFFAILAVGASGVYFNLRESHPDLLREKAEREEAARNATPSLPELAKFEVSQGQERWSQQNAAPLPVPPIPDSIVPRSNPAIPDTAATDPPASTADPFKIAQAALPERSAVPEPELNGTSTAEKQTVASYSADDLDRMINNPDTGAGKPAAKGYRARFKQLFGMKVIERTYPSMAMKQRALRLWAREQKILEPDGSINDKYAPKRESSPIPGH